MTEKLKRITSEADHHKVLDLAYLAAFVIGVTQFSEAMKAINVPVTETISVTLLAIQMGLMAVCGGLGYYWHIRGQVFKELSIAVPIIMGFVTLIVGSAITQAMAPVKDPFFVNLGGLSITIALWFVIEVFERVYKVNARRRQLKISKTVREKVEIPTDPKIIIQKANEIGTNAERG